MSSLAGRCIGHPTIGSIGVCLQPASRVKLSRSQEKDNCGRAYSRISMETGIDQSTRSRSMSGERGLSMNALHELAEHLDLNITVGKGRKPRRNK